MKKVLVLIATIVISLSLVSNAFAAVYVSATVNVNTVNYKVSSTTTGSGQYILFECSIKNRNTTTTDTNTTSWGTCTLEKKLSNGTWDTVETTYVDETGSPGHTTNLTRGGITLAKGVQYRVTAWIDITQFDSKANLYAAITDVTG